jgi:hypothetical protein
MDPRLGRITIADWATVWMQTTVHLRPSTRAGYEGKLRAHVLPRLGSVPVISLDTPAIRRFVAEMAADGVSPATILGVRAVLRLLLGTAVEAGAILVNPCTGTKVPRPTRPEMHFLTAEQVEDLADTISTPEPKVAGHGASPHWRTDLPEYGLLIRFAAYTGLRAGEIGALRVGRLDFSGHTRHLWPPPAGHRRAPHSRSRRPRAGRSRGLIRFPWVTFGSRRGHDPSRGIAEIGVEQDSSQWARQGSNLRPKDYEARLEQLVLLRGLAPGCANAVHKERDASDSERDATGCDELQGNCWDASDVGTARPALDRPPGA